ncbi:hypothetical protein CVT91_06915 [Candidatus Atribacteria bacterium HGW-Atribacteria-1]|nr:MAG: hypothetical protein CVT91_06915 [Candidatus Atribacteria bacterium HGW-Atribacteria-1]
MGKRYRLNPLYADFIDYYGFQVEPLKAIGLAKLPVVEMIIKELENKDCSEALAREILENNHKIEDITIDKLIENNIIIDSRFFKKKILAILKKHIKIVLERKGADQVKKISQIFRYNSSLMGHQILRILFAAVSKNLHFKIKIFDQQSMIVEVYTKRGQKRIFNSNTAYDFFSQDQTAVKLAQSKSLTNFILSRCGIPVPKQQVFINGDLDRVFEFINKIGYPVCIKDEHGTEGKDVFPDLVSEKEVQEVVYHFIKQKKSL